MLPALDASIHSEVLGKSVVSYLRESSPAYRGKLTPLRQFPQPSITRRCFYKSGRPGFIDTLP